MSLGDLDPTMTTTTRNLSGDTGENGTLGPGLAVGEEELSLLTGQRPIPPLKGMVGQVLVEISVSHAGHIRMILL